jgi:acetyl esterase
VIRCDYFWHPDLDWSQVKNVSKTRLLRRFYACQVVANGVCVHIRLAERLFVLGCSTIAFLARPRLVNDTRLGLALTRRFYSLLCAAFTGSRQQVASVEDVCLERPDRTLALRLYRARTDQVLPAIIFLHGGCYTVGDLDSHDALARALANATTSTVIVVDYRLSPEHPFPAAADDAYCALEWLSANADNLGVDRNLIVLAGDSAGGALAAVVARWARDRRGPNVALQLLMYPVTNAAMQSSSWEKFANGPVLNRSILETAWRRYAPNLEQRLSGEVSPLPASDLSGLPPTIVVTAERDPLRDEAEEYARALDLAQVPVSLLHYPGTVHGFLQVPDTHTSQKAIVDIAAEFANLLGFATHDSDRMVDPARPDSTALTLGFHG